MATQGPSAIIGERKPPAPGRTMFTMLIPQWYEIGAGSVIGGTVEFDRKKMVGMFEERAQVGVQHIAGVEVVIVSATEKEDLHSLTSPVVDSLVNILKYLMPPRTFSDAGCFQTRLLVRNDQALHLIRSSIFQTIQEEHQGELVVYLSDYSLGLSIGYSIIEFNGWKLDSVSEAVKKIAFKVREIPVSEDELGGCLFELSPEGSSEREYELIKGIHISRVNEEIIGENGAKIEKLQAKRSLTFSITPAKFKPNYFIIYIDGALADVNDAENILELEETYFVPLTFADISRLGWVSNVLSVQDEMRGPNRIKVSHVYKKMWGFDDSLDDFY